MNIEIYKNLAAIFSRHGFRLYMIGGTSRDYLLGIDSKDYDFVSDATPTEIKAILKDEVEKIEDHFEKYGVLKVKYMGVSIDLVTLREEKTYTDHRHPNEITFVKELEKDYPRRDFTINALYIDENLNVIDFTTGLEDLKNKTIRFIGDPLTRIKEDPLRIVRAYRFAKKLGFTIEENTLKIFKENEHLLDTLNPDKIKEEERKANS